MNPRTRYNKIPHTHLSSIKRGKFFWVIGETKRCCSCILDVCISIKEDTIKKWKQQIQGCLYHMDSESTLFIIYLQICTCISVRNRKGFLEIQLNERISKPQEIHPSYFGIVKWPGKKVIKGGNFCFHLSINIQIIWWLKYPTVPCT